MRILIPLMLVLAMACGVNVAVSCESNPDQRTQAFVERAIERYEQDGLETTVAYYNDPANVDGQWYVFIIGRDDRILAHYRPERIGLDVATMVDSKGRLYGPELLEATDDGVWVSYWFLNPDTDQEHEKHSWVVEKDGLIFGSGWYE